MTPCSLLLSASYRLGTVSGTVVKLPKSKDKCGSIQATFTVWAQSTCGRETTNQPLRNSTTKFERGFRASLPNSAQPTAQASSAPPAPDVVPPPIVQVSPGVLEGFLVDHPAPEYPPLAKESHIQGRVVLVLTIDKTGATRDIRVLTSPDQTLTDSAVSAVSRWHYRPYQLNGSPVEVQSTVVVNFKLP